LLKYKNTAWSCAFCQAPAAGCRKKTTHSAHEKNCEKEKGKNVKEAARKGIK
jgi:hypothetical protein